MTIASSRAGTRRAGGGGAVCGASPQLWPYILRAEVEGVEPLPRDHPTSSLAPVRVGLPMPPGSRYDDRLPRP
jgi:hypothetical protein